ncbi:MAG: EVE domain-containing protein, partial [Fimbriimonadales bacterium]
FMKDQMQVGDGVLFYYSSCAEPGVVGIAEIASEPYPDHTQYDSKSEYFDPTSKADKPKWWMVDVKPVQKLPKYVSLKLMRETAELEGMITLRKGNRLSITPVTAEEWKAIRKMGGLK